VATGLPSHKPGKQDEKAAKPPEETEKKKPYICDKRKTRPTVFMYGMQLKISQAGQRTEQRSCNL